MLIDTELTGNRKWCDEHMRSCLIEFKIYGLTEKGIVGPMLADWHELGD